MRDQGSGDHTEKTLLSWRGKSHTWSQCAERILKKLQHELRAGGQARGDEVVLNHDRRTHRKAADRTRGHVGLAKWSVPNQGKQRD